MTLIKQTLLSTAIFVNKFTINSIVHASITATTTEKHTLAMPHIYKTITDFDTYDGVGQYRIFYSPPYNLYTSEPALKNAPVP
jgi:hypothetical protein